MKALVFSKLAFHFVDEDRNNSLEDEFDVLTGEFEHDDTFDSLMDVFTNYNDDVEELNKLDTLV